MDVYRTRPGAPKPEMCVKHAEDVDGRPSDAFVCPSAKGFVLYAVNVLTVSSKHVFPIDSIYFSCAQSYLPFIMFITSVYNNITNWEVVLALDV